MEKIKSHAKFAIIGGGILGVSLLYHLTKEGWKDLVLIEKGELTSGSTWHAAGQCPHMVGSYNLAKVHLHSTNLYKSLEKETGQATGWHGCGSLRLAYKQEDLDWFFYVKGILDNVGAPAEIISTNEIPKIHPFIKLDGIIGGFIHQKTGIQIQQARQMQWPKEREMEEQKYIETIVSLILKHVRQENGKL